VTISGRSSDAASSSSPRNALVPVASRVASDSGEPWRLKPATCSTSRTAASPSGENGDASRETSTRVRVSSSVGIATERTDATDSSRSRFRDSSPRARNAALRVKGSSSSTTSTTGDSSPGAKCRPRASKPCTDSLSSGRSARASFTSSVEVAASSIGSRTTSARPTAAPVGT
jgi:hypothetical protein